MTDITYAATDLITGRILADSLPLEVQNFSTALNGGGTLNGALNLRAAQSANAPFVEALEFKRAVLWALAGGYPVWNGVVWDWPDTTRTTGQLPIAAQTIDSVWSKRLVTSAITYNAVDMFTVFIDLLQYGASKTSPYITDGSGPVSPLVAAAAAVAGVIVPSGALSGVPWTTNYAAADQTQIAQAWADLVASGNLEFAFVPGFDSSGNLATFLQLGYTQLGRPSPASGYGLTYPGNADDYGYTRTGSTSANAVLATAPPNGAAVAWQSQYPHGYDLAELAAGYPLLEVAASWNTSVVTGQAQIDGWADGQVTLLGQSQTTPVIKVAGGQRPGLTDLVLGDTVPFSATSELHPAGPGGGPGLRQLVRVSGWTYTPSGPNQAESIQIATSGVIAA